MLLGVVTRALGDPLIWTDEMSRFLMIWAACVGWMLATRKRSHIRIRYFHGKLPAPARRIVEILTQFSIALFGLLLIVHGAELVRRNYDMEATSVPLSMAVIYLPAMLGGAVALAEALAAMLDAWQDRERAS